MSKSEHNNGGVLNHFGSFGSLTITSGDGADQDGQGHAYAYGRGNGNAYAYAYGHDADHHLHLQGPPQTHGDPPPTPPPPGPTPPPVTDPPPSSPPPGGGVLVGQTVYGVTITGEVYYSPVAANITGTAANDYLVGGAGHNVLDGGAGNDVLSGGPELSGTPDPGDTFVFAPGSGQDVITDFQGADTIDISAYLKAGDHVQMADFSMGALLDLGTGDTITLIGVSTSQLVATSTGFSLA